MVVWNGVKDEINESVIKLSTTAGKFSPVGSYPIIAKNAQKQLNDNYPNYTFTIKEGKLNIKDNGDKNFWDIDDDGCPDLNIEIEDEEGNTILINGDLNEDGIPDYNIDTNGDFKADINIEKDGRLINVVNHITWKPDKNFTYQGFAYDTEGNLKPLLNIDTDGDGRPDLNIDLDDDGSADINIDTDGDFIPNTNIDGTGDGKPDINVDENGDGLPDSNIMDITTWKPEHNVNQPFPYDTMKIKEKTELEDNGVKVEKTDGTPFLPNMTLKVTDVTDDKKDEVNSGSSALIDKEQEIKQVFEIKLLENGIEVKPDGSLKIRIPIKEEYRNPTLIHLTENGSYEKINAIIEDGYLVYESDELGLVSLIADVIEDKGKDDEVQGSYYPGDNVGGALTGDITNQMMYVGMGCISLGLICLVIFKKKQEE